MPNSYPAEFYYTEKSSAAEYSYVAQGTLDVSRLINGKAFWKKDLAHINKPKAILLADWTAKEWSDKKVRSVSAKIRKMMGEGFVFYIQNGEQVEPLMEKDLFKLNNSDYRLQLVPVNLERLINTAVQQDPKLLSPSKIYLLDDYRLDNLLEDFPAEPRERVWPLKTVERNLSNPEFFSFLQKANPLLRFISASYPMLNHPEISSHPFHLEKVVIFQDLTLTQDSATELLNAHVLQANGDIFKEAYLDNVEQLTLEGNQSPLIGSQLHNFLRRLPKLKRLVLENFINDDGLEYSPHSIQQVEFKNFSFLGNQLKNLIVLATFATQLKFCRIPSTAVSELLEYLPRLPRYL